LYHCLNNTSNAKELSELIEEKTLLTQNIHNHLITIGKLEEQLQRVIGSNNVLRDQAKIITQHVSKQDIDFDYPNLITSQFEKHFKRSTMKNKKQLGEQEKRIQNLEKEFGYFKDKQKAKEIIQNKNNI